jgi:hypothetical protein
MFSRHDLPSRQGTSASAAGCRQGGAKRTAFALEINLGARRAARPFLSTDRGARGDPVGRLTSWLTLAGQLSEAAWIKSQERSATDELR